LPQFLCYFCALGYQWPLWPYISINKKIIVNRGALKRELLMDIINNKSLNVLDAGLPSLRVSLECSEGMPKYRKNEMLQLMDIIQSHYDIIRKYVDENVSDHQRRNH